MESFELMMVVGKGTFGKVSIIETADHFLGAGFDLDRVLCWIAFLRLTFTLQLTKLCLGTDFSGPKSTGYAGPKARYVTNIRNESKFSFGLLLTLSSLPLLACLGKT